MCAAGPPKAMHPNFKNRPATSLSADADVDSVFASLKGNRPPVGGGASSALAAISSNVSAGPSPGAGVYPFPLLHHGHRHCGASGEAVSERPRLYHSHGLCHWRPLTARPRLCHEPASRTRRQATAHEVSRPGFLINRHRQYGRMAIRCESEGGAELQHRPFFMRRTPEVCICCRCRRMATLVTLLRTIGTSSALPGMSLPAMCRAHTQHRGQVKTGMWRG
jgi:hypothetical protein